MSLALLQIYLTEKPAFNFHMKMIVILKQYSALDTHFCADFLGLLFFPLLLEVRAKLSFARVPQDQKYIGIDICSVNKRNYIISRKELHPESCVLFKINF